MELRICPSCYTQNQMVARRCSRCRKSFSKPVPVFWFMYMALLFVTYVTLDFYHML
ncbi:MAG: hypothetical protein HYV27_13345 [Candidatus Hydrogenedentes bacterium]|nr:hypothetical protein [Candidatus Hydrogenedentota bacterium]